MMGIGIIGLTSVEGDKTKLKSQKTVTEWSALGFLWPSLVWSCSVSRLVFHVSWALLHPKDLCRGYIENSMLCTRQWREVSDFVARFCTLHESNNTRNARFARETRAILAWPCVVWLALRAKMCDTNHIPRATAYLTLIFSLLWFSRDLREAWTLWSWVWWLWTGFWTHIHPLSRHFHLQILFKCNFWLKYMTKEGYMRC